MPHFRSFNQKHMSDRFMIFGHNFGKSIEVFHSRNHYDLLRNDAFKGRPRIRRNDVGVDPTRESMSSFYF